MTGAGERSWLSPAKWLRHMVFWGGAVTTGAAAVVFARGADEAQTLFQWVLARFPASAWIVPPVGLALIAWLTRRFFPGSQGSGIPQTIAALSLTAADARDRLLSLRIAAGKLVLTVAGLGCGASAGREGPTVQIGASIMHSLGRLVRFPAADLDRGLILAGGAAGVAAAFNTPLAGVDARNRGVVALFRGEDLRHDSYNSHPGGSHVRGPGGGLHVFRVDPRGTGRSDDVACRPSVAWSVASLAACSRVPCCPGKRFCRLRSAGYAASRQSGLRLSAA